MKDLMVHIAEKPVEVQKEILDLSIEKWKGEVQQVDDILVIGRKF